MNYRLLLHYALLLAWMGLIYYASDTPDLRAVPLAQRFGFLPDFIGQEMTDLLELLLRKGAHMVSFGILALLAYSALATTVPGWSARRIALAAVIIAVLYAISDEWHQSFVPTRVGSYKDVLIDAAGAAIGLLLVRRVRKG